MTHDVSRPGQAANPTWTVTPELMAVIDGEGVFEDVNPAWSATLGWTREDLLGHAFPAFLHPDDRPPTLEQFLLLRAGHPVLRFENRYRCKDGRYRWLSWVGVQEGARYHCSARDITSERAAVEERAHLWALSEDMLARANYEGMMTAVNPAWTEVLGFSQQELLSRPYVDFMHPEDSGVTVEALGAMGRTGQPTRFENRILTRSGQWKRIGWTVSPEPDGLNFIAIGRDLSSYVAREQELLAAQEALRQAQKMEAVGQLTGGIAHDFNNLLNGISLNLEMVARRAALGQADTLSKYIAMAQSSVRRGATLTQRLLAFSRRQTLDPRPVDVNRLVAEVLDLVRTTVGPSVVVAVEHDPALWPAYLDASQLENALVNLCINARDAMQPDGGRLTIVTGNRRVVEREAGELDLAPGDYLCVGVSDTGCGMPPEVIARAFDPFFTTKPLGQGTGLGLSMVYGFVRQSGGQVRVASRVGEGTTMVLYFPRHAGDPDAPEKRTQEEIVPGEGAVILLIDDEEAIRVVVGEALELAGYRVLQAADGPSGLKLLQASERIDLLVTDVGLPGGMNGRQVADAARTARPQLKVLFITGYADKAAVGNGLLDPGMHVLVKPFETAALASRIGQLLEEA